MFKIILNLILFFSFGVFNAQTEHFFEINGVQRKAIYYLPKTKTEKIPVVIVFHGHFGNAKNCAKTIDFYTQYPEALVIYMEGIPGVINSRLDKKGQFNGWQMNPNELNDRDILFFDTVYISIDKEFSINKEKIFAVGHSNGARFVNVLWKTRAEIFKAFCTVAGPGGFWMRTASPKSAWISFGKKDTIVPYTLQEKVAVQYKKLLYKNVKSPSVDGEISTYKAENGLELIIEDRNAGHEFPINSIPKIIEFFKRQN